jgi:hypothetical protein
MTRALAVLLAVSCATSAAALTTQQSTLGISYEVFCKLPDVERKRAAFVSTTAENQAELVRTHVERWRDANQARLNAKQLEFLKELIAFLGPEAYSTPRSNEVRTRQRDFSAQQRALFSYDDLQAMEPNGPCIAKAR